EEGNPHPDDDRPVTFPGLGRGAALAFSPDGHWLAASSAGNNVRLYDVHSGAERILSRYTEEDPESVTHTHLAFSPDGEWLTTGLRGEWLLSLWNLADDTTGHSEQLLGTREDEETEGLLYSPDNGLLASWSSRGAFIVLTAEGEELDDEG